MAITNGYTTLPLLKAEVSIPDSNTDSDVQLETAIAAASRQIDGHCGRRFWQDPTVVTREFFADSSFDLEDDLDDISVTTGLIVKTDTSDTGTFDTTLTITTNFIVLPANAADRLPAWPFTKIRIVDSGVSSFPMSSSGRPGVQVTAKFGWSAVPDDVAKACLIQATQLFKSSAAVFGGLSFGDGSFLTVRAAINPQSAALLEQYSRARFA